MPIDVKAFTDSEHFQRLSEEQKAQALLRANEMNAAEAKHGRPPVESPVNSRQVTTVGIKLGLPIALGATGAAVGGPLGGAAGGITGGVIADQLNRLRGVQSEGVSLEGAGATVGEAVGEMITPPGAKPLGGGVGAGLGSLAEDVVRGRSPDIGRAGTEALAATTGGLVESGARGALRSFAADSPGGQQIRYDVAARRARELPQDVFSPQPKEQISQAFDLVRQSGVRLRTDPLQSEIARHSEGVYGDLLSDIKRIDADHRTGGRYAALVESLRRPQAGAPRVTAWDIGDLQQFSSFLRQRAERNQTPQARQLLADLRSRVDEVIFQGAAVGRQAGSAQETQALLGQARKDWARFRAAEDMGQFVENHISNTNNPADLRLNFRQLQTDLRRGNSPLTESINRALDLTPGARERLHEDLERIAQAFHSIEISAADVTGLSRIPVVGQVRQMVGAALLTPVGRRLFTRALVEGRGRLSANNLTIIANAARRDLAPELQVFPTREQEPE